MQLLRNLRPKNGVGSDVSKLDQAESGAREQLPQRQACLVDSAARFEAAN